MKPEFSSIAVPEVEQVEKPVGECLSCLRVHCMHSTVSVCPKVSVMEKFVRKVLNGSTHRRLGYCLILHVPSETLKPVSDIALSRIGDVIGRRLTERSHVVLIGS